MMNYETLISKLKFDAAGLIPAIAQDARTDKVLMLAYMNAEAIKLTMETKRATYFSRSRQNIWVKGETSGNVQDVIDMLVDCDGDTLLLKVNQTGVACHTGKPTCFNECVFDCEAINSASIMWDEFDVIMDRKANPREGSYTNYLFDKGIDKICKKVGEESAEVIIAAKNRSKDEVSYETADLFYHVMVLLAEQGMTPRDVFNRMKERSK